MPLVTYQQVRPWASAIREAVMLDKMPPWHASKEGSVPFANDRSLSVDDKNIIERWVKDGAQDGAATSHRPAADHAGWHLGKPDVVLRTPSYRIPREGTVDYLYLILPTGFTQDTWIEGAEFHPGQRTVIHHINAYSRSPNSRFLRSYEAGKLFVPAKSDKSRAGESLNSFEELANYEPGYEPHRWPTGNGKLIRAGADIVLQIHYTASGKEAIDSTQLGLYFATKPVSRRLLSIAILDTSFVIPAGDSAVESHAQVDLGQPVQLYSLQPHMHVRGKSMTVRAVSAGKDPISLINVPRYDFNWQTTYLLKDPLFLPAGTRIEEVATFDNSPANPRNPDPKSTVRWGEQSWEEMNIVYATVIIPAGSDAAAVVKKKPN
jgi:hypothetical protein